MVVWANCHGGFATGFILLGVYWSAELAGWFLELIKRQSLTIDAGDQIRIIQSSIINPDFYA